MQINPPEQNPEPDERGTGVTLQHVPVGVIGDGVDMRRHLMAFLALVHLDDLLRVYWQHLVGIHHHTEQT